MNAVKTIRSLFAKWGRDRPETTAKPSGLAPLPQSPSPAERIQPCELDRRQFFLAVGASLIAASPAVARLTRIFPHGDSWRFGWIVPENTPWKVYYGIDTANPEAMVVYLARGEELLNVTLDELERNHFKEAAAEIKISQGHLGLQATGGLRMLPGDEEDFAVADFAGDSETVMIDEHLKKPDQTVEQIADAVVAGMDRGPTRPQKVMADAIKLGWKVRQLSGERFELRSASETRIMTYDELVEFLDA